MKKLHILTWVFTLLCLYSCKKDKSPEAEPVKEQTESEAGGGYTVMTYTIANDPNMIPIDTANKMISSYLRSLEDNDGNLHSLVVSAESLRAYLRDTSIKKVKIMFAHTQDYINSGHDGEPAGLKASALTVVLAGFRSDGTYILAPGSKVLDRADPCPHQCPPYGDASNDLIQ